jgi:hypothetical protein
MAKKAAKESRATPKKRKRHLRLAVIPEPEPMTRTVLKHYGEGTVILQGPAQVVMDCGNCGEPLTDGWRPDLIENVVLVCHNCGSFNETLA